MSDHNIKLFIWVPVSYLSEQLPKLCYRWNVNNFVIIQPAITFSGTLSRPSEWERPAFQREELITNRCQNICRQTQFSLLTKLCHLVRVPFKHGAVSYGTTGESPSQRVPSPVAPSHIIWFISAADDWEMTAHHSTPTTVVIVDSSHLSAGACSRLLYLMYEPNRTEQSHQAVFPWWVSQQISERRHPNLRSLSIYKKRRRRLGVWRSSCPSYKGDALDHLGTRQGRTETLIEQRKTSGTSHVHNSSIRLQTTTSKVSMDMNQPLEVWHTRPDWRLVKWWVNGNGQVYKQRTGGEGKFGIHGMAKIWYGKAK